MTSTAGTHLKTDWTIILRARRVPQAENECNTADAVGVANGFLTITTTAGRRRVETSTSTAYRRAAAVTIYLRTLGLCVLARWAVRAVARHDDQRVLRRQRPCEQQE